MFCIFTKQMTGSRQYRFWNRTQGWGITLKAEGVMDSEREAETERENILQNAGIWPKEFKRPTVAELEATLKT